MYLFLFWSMTVSPLYLHVVTSIERVLISHWLCAYSTSSHQSSCLYTTVTVVVRCVWWSKVVLLPRTMTNEVTEIYCHCQRNELIKFRSNHRILFLKLLLFSFFFILRTFLKFGLKYTIWKVEFGMGLNKIWRFGSVLIFFNFKKSLIQIQFDFKNQDL